MREELAAPSRAHVVRKALGVLQVFLELQKEGKSVYYDENGKKTRIILTGPI